LGGWEERGHGVREDNLSDDSIFVLFACSTVFVPVSISGASFWSAFLEIAERVPVLISPFFELVMPPCFKVGLVIKDLSTGVGI
jgi:hypothetical protein